MNYTKIYRDKKRSWYRKYNNEWMKQWRKDNPQKHKEQLLKKKLVKYNIDLAYYNNLLLQQNNSCALCLKPWSESYKGLAIDHCHLTGKIRGLLCQTCNQAIGLLKDNPILMRKAAEYVEQA